MPDEDPITITLPLNGYKNFNFYYTEDGNSFLSGGGYTVTYKNSSGTNCYGNSDFVVYNPNGSHTNGVAVRMAVLYTLMGAQGAPAQEG